MKKLIFLICLIPSICFGDAWTVGLIPIGTASAPACADSSCTGFEVCQNFEGTGYDNSESWTTWNGTPAEDDTTATLLRGSQQMALDNTDRVYIGVAGSPGQGSLHFRYKAADGTPSTAFRFIKISYNGAGDDTSIALYHRTDGNIRAYNGGSYATSSTTPLATDNTAVHIWVDFTLGTGSDGTLSVYTSSDSTKPASAAVEVTNGTATSANSYDRLSLWNDGSATSEITYFDQVLFDTSSTIGDVCD